MAEAINFEAARDAFYAAQRSPALPFAVNDIERVHGSAVGKLNFRQHL